MSKLRDQTISGLKWSAATQILSQALQFLIGVVLARLLTPSEFGIIGIVLIFSGFAALFSELGLSSALIQRTHITEFHLSTVFWLNLAAGAIASLLLAACAPLISSFYERPALAPMINAVAVTLFVGALPIVQQALLQREMDFRRLFWIDTTAFLVSGSVAVLCALSGYGAWSLVFQAVVRNVCYVALVWALTTWRPRCLFKFSAVNDLWGFSSHLLGFNAVNYWIRQSDKAMLGKYHGVISLGEYTRAYSLMLLPIQQLSGVASRVMLPALSRMQSDLPALRATYLQATRLIGLVTFPLMTGLLVVAEPLILTVFGPNWAGVTPIFQVLCLEGITQGVATTVGWIYTSTGRTDYMFRWALFSGLVRVLGFCIGLPWGALGVAYSYVLTGYLILWYPGWSIAGRLIGLSFADMVWNLAPSFLPAFVMALLTHGFGFALSTSLPLLPVYVQLLSQIFVGVAVYWLLVSSFKVRAYLEAKALFRSQFRSSLAR